MFSNALNVLSFILYLFIVPCLPIKTIHFNYGADGIIGFSLKRDIDLLPTEYFYKKNVQGDIIGIYDANGVEKTRYVYDAWGNHKVFAVEDDNLIDITENHAHNNIGHINPFRYRSYYYDTETKLYYLNSRYYDPELSRFINADDVSYLDPDTFNGLNLYAYCLNNPVMMLDDEGNLPKWLQWLAIGAAILGAILVVAAITVLTAGVGTTILAGTMAGAIIHGAAVGALIGAGVGIVAGGIIGGAVSGWSAEGILAGMALGFGGGALVGAAIGGAVGGIQFAASSVHSVYISKGANGAVNYVGRTSNIAQRTAAHAANGKGVVPQQIAKNLSLRNARGLEQALINKYGLMKNGGILINRINSIAVTSPIYKQAVAWGVKFITKILPFL